IVAWAQVLVAGVLEAEGNAALAIEHVAVEEREGLGLGGRLETLADLRLDRRQNLGGRLLAGGREKVFEHRDGFGTGHEVAVGIDDESAGNLGAAKRARRRRRMTGSAS